MAGQVSLLLRLTCWPSQGLSDSGPRKKHLGVGMASAHGGPAGMGAWNAVEMATRNLGSGKLGAGSSTHITRVRVIEKVGHCQALTPSFFFTSLREVQFHWRLACLAVLLISGLRLLGPCIWVLHHPANADLRCGSLCNPELDACQILGVDLRDTGIQWRLCMSSFDWAFSLCAFWSFGEAST